MRHVTRQVLLSFGAAPSLPHRVAIDAAWRPDAEARH
jgi:hypothetical protein